MSDILRRSVHHEGDCEQVLRDHVADGSVQLIVTSPPYADARKATYGGTPPDEYVAWFLPRAAEFKRVLKPGGTFILNIKENVVAGERHTYVIDLIKGLRDQGWLWTEEWIWHKQNTMPGKWPNRFRDEWEHVFQFNKQRAFDMYQDKVMEPIGDWAKTRLQKLKGTDLVRHKAATGSGFARNLLKWKDRVEVYPGNVLHFASECSNKQHSAAFPLKLPEFFIRLFSKTGDLVLDPFAGSGTTGVAALGLERHYIGVDLLPKNIELADQRILNEVEGRQATHREARAEKSRVIADLLANRSTVISTERVEPKKFEFDDMMELADEVAATTPDKT